MLERTVFGGLLTGFCLLVFAYVLAPLVVIVLTSFSDTGYIVFPPQGFTLRHYANILNNRLYLSGFATSVTLAGTVTVLAMLAALPASYAIARMEFRGRSLIEGLFLSPLMLPGLVSAVALTIFMSRVGAPAGMPRLVLGHLAICTACAMRVMIPAFQRLDRSIEEAAMNLGAGPLRTFALVSLPVVRPGLLAAAALSFVWSFDEVERTLFLASPRQPPLTVVLYSEVQNKFEPTISAVSACLILGVVLAVLLIQGLRSGRWTRTS